MQLVLNANTAQNPLTLDLTKFIDVQKGDGLDPAAPTYSEKVWARSLLREGATLALENTHEREIVFPLKLNAATSTAVAQLVEQINQACRAPGATVTWQDDGLSQATTFNLISGQWDTEYDYRMVQKSWLAGKLRLFVEPFGRTAGPRAYAAASGVGPLLMISPYASGGANVLAASTQAGISGFGGQQQPSGGVFYQGSATLQGDAPALLQVSFTDIGPNGASNAGTVPYVAVSLLPDQYYQPLKTTNDFRFQSAANESFITGANFPDGVAVDASHVYWTTTNSIGRANIDGTSPSQSWITGANAPDGVAVDASHVYWVNNGNNTIGRANIDGTSPSQSWITGANGPTGIAIDASHVYWVNLTAIARANIDGTSPSQSWITGNAPDGVAVDASHVYWTNTNGNTIARANIDGTSPSQSWITGANTPEGVAVDASHVYWTNTNGNTIARANIDGTSPQQQWVTGANQPIGVAVDASHVYWANFGANSIGRANLLAMFSRTAVASSYASYPSSATQSIIDTHMFSPIPAPAGTADPTAGWAGNHRLLAIARASGAGAGTLTTQANALVAYTTTATVTAQQDWGLFDLGTFSLRASEFPQQQVAVSAGVYPRTGSAVALDVTAYVMLPDNATWFLNPTAIQPSQYGYPPGVAGQYQLSPAPYTGTILLDDTIGDQFIYSVASQTFAPSPTGMVPSSARISPYTRGLVPRPDPKNGPPILAILGVGQNSVPSTSQSGMVGASWSNQQNLASYAQVDVLERARYLLP